MKNETLIYEFEPIIYPFPLLITKSFDADEMCEHFDIINANNEVVAATDEFIFIDDTTARILQVIDKVTLRMYFLVLLVRTDVIDTGICTHEAVHLANAYLQYLGFNAPLSYDDEAYAYFAQWAANCMECILRDAEEQMFGKRFMLKKA